LPEQKQQTERDGHGQPRSLPFRTDGNSSRGSCRSSDGCQFRLPPSKLHPYAAYQQNYGVHEQQRWQLHRNPVAHQLIRSRIQSWQSLPHDVRAGEGDKQHQHRRQCDEQTQPRPPQTRRIIGQARAGTAVIAASKNRRRSSLFASRNCGFVKSCGCAEAGHGRFNVSSLQLPRPSASRNRAARPARCIHKDRCAPRVSLRQSCRAAAALQ